MIIISFTIFESGTKACATQINSNYDAIYKLQGEKAINDVSATNSGILAGSSQVLIDKFLDATGQNNTVDTGVGTTGIYNNYYKYNNCTKLMVTNPVLEPDFESATNWTYSELDTNGYLSGVLDSSWKTKGSYSYKLNKNYGNGTANNYCQILQPVDFTNISIITFDYKAIQGENLEFTFSASIGATTIFSSQPGAGTSTGTIIYDCSAITGTQNLIFKMLMRATASNQPESSFNIDNILCYDTTFKDSIVQSVATTIPTGMTKVFVTPLMYEALSTGDSITADVSIDNGSTYTTDVPINEWTEITSANGTSLVLKLNLLTGDGSTTPKVSGWRVLLE